MDPNRVKTVLRDFYGGRRVIVVGRPFDECRSLLNALAEFGAGATFVVANGRPEQTGQPLSGVFHVDLGYSNVNAVMATTEALLACPPPQLETELDRFDPEREALVVTESNVRQPALSGRQVLDSRNARWAKYDGALESARLWQSLGIRTPPRLMVSPTPTALGRALTELDYGHGVVLYPDMRGTVHEPIYAARYIRSRGDLDNAAGWLALTSDVVVAESVIPGTPTSICGFVLQNGDVAVMRPHEEVILTAQGEASLRHAGCSTLFSPKTETSDRIQVIARTVGTRLHTELGFRGAFAVAGITNTSGFLPSYLSTWLNHGHRHLAGATPDINWALLNGAIRGSASLDLSAYDLDVALANRIDLNPRVTAGVVLVGMTVAAPRTLAIEFDDDDDVVRATAILIPTPDGSVLAITGSALAVEGLRSVSRRIARAVNIAISEWDLPVRPVAAWPSSSASE